MYAYIAGNVEGAPPANPDEIVIIVDSAGAETIANILRQWGDDAADYYAKVIEDGVLAVTP